MQTEGDVANGGLGCKGRMRVETENGVANGG